MLISLTLEELIGLKLELGARSINYKMYGLPIWSAIPTIVKEATLKCAVSITRTKGEAARFLGLNRSHLKQLIKKYEIDNYFEEIYLPWMLTDDKMIVEGKYHGAHEFKPEYRGACYTAQFEGTHPFTISHSLQMLQKKIHSQLEKYT